jgi:peptidoglycan-associated lipoprotein
MVRSSLLALPLLVVCLSQTACASDAAQRRVSQAATVAAPPPKGRPPASTPAEVRSVESPPIPGSVGQLAFAFDRADLDGAAQHELRRVADLLLAERELEVSIEGHCDERGTGMYNLALGDRRARAAQRYLMALGVDPSRVHVVSFGEEMPAVAAHDEAGHARNRRGELTFFKRASREARAEPTYLRFQMTWGG